MGLFSRNNPTDAAPAAPKPAAAPATPTPTPTPTPTKPDGVIPGLAPGGLTSAPTAPLAPPRAAPAATVVAPPGLSGAAIGVGRPDRPDRPGAPSLQSERQVYLQQLKVRMHQQLVERLDMQN